MIDKGIANGKYIETNDTTHVKKERKNFEENFFKERTIFRVRLPYSSENQKFSKLFVNKIEDYTNGKVKFVLIWNTCKIQSLFNYKDKVQHRSCVIYRSVCLCGADYIVETIRNSE